MRNCITPVANLSACPSSTSLNEALDTENVNARGSASDNNDVEISDEMMSPKNLMRTMSNNNSNSNCETKCSDGVIELISLAYPPGNDEHLK